MLLKRRNLTLKAPVSEPSVKISLFPSCLIFGIDEILGLGTFKHFHEVFSSLPFSHREVVEHVVSAVARRCPGDIAIEIGNEAECLGD